jgi:phosphoribosylformimino-5-aminoimidazole carboxamide ribonucleotide (ProFAR) isomerase
VCLKIYPTINLQHGRVIPTAGRGEPCSLSPLDLASQMLEEGACRMALVDVDAALGSGNNRELIGQILKHCRASERKICIQVAGGIRSSDQAQFFIDQGAAWLVVGTILHKSPMVVDQLLARFQPYLTAAVDARGGQVHRSGWVDNACLSATDMAIRAKAYGFKRLLFVDIPEEAGAEPDFITAGNLAKASGLPIIMGGSITAPHHLKALYVQPGLKGALVDALLFREDPRLLAFLQTACA